MTAELRKYAIGVVASHQYLTQVEPPVIDAVLGNAGTIIAFRLGPRDAALAGEFEPKLEATDLVNLPNHQIYLKLMIDGAPSQPFSANTLRPDVKELVSPTFVTETGFEKREEARPAEA